MGPWRSVGIMNSSIGLCWIEEIEGKDLFWAQGTAVTSLVLTCIQNVEFQKLELKWSARKSNKIVFLFPSPKFLDLILASTIPLGFKPC
jgi:hypothetical protein